MTPARKTLIVGRAMIGLGALVAPGLTARFFGMKDEPSNRFITRLFGARETALAVAVATAPPDKVAAAAATGAVIDSVDSISGFDEWRQGNIGTQALLLGPVGVIGVAALGFYVAHEASQPTQHWAG